MDRTALKTRGILLILLALVTLATFWPVLRNDFIKYDDGLYITDNPRVLNGLTWADAGWAFQAGYGSNWHPLTWLSHMLDVQLFGVKPLGHHLMSLLLHTTNAALLFLLLNRMTGAIWRSFFVAGFFALHPLHVESVAWASERKDVLSTFFFMLTLLAYVRWVQGKNEWRQKAEDTDKGTQTAVASVPALPRPGSFYYLALAWFALGLMSKPMLVTTPFVLLLLDIWPLQRFRPGTSGISSSNAAALVMEKVPFLALALLSSVLTFIAQEKSHAVVVGMPLLVRTANAITAYLKYLGKTIWPSHLAIFYPHPNVGFFVPNADGTYPPSQQWPVWEIITAAVLLSAISILFVLRRRKEPWLTVGWFWYLGTLVPVIGVIQVGTQAMADRYTYISLIGIFVACVWSAHFLVSAWKLRPEPPVFICVALLALCGLLTRKQISYWRDNYTVFSHALTATPANAVAEFNLVPRFVERKQYGLAQAHLRRALSADPTYGEAYSALGYVYETLGKTDLALEQFRTAVRLRPWDDLSRCHMASILEGLGRRDEAIALYQEALRINPDNVRAHYYLGLALCDRGDLEAGANQCAAALRLRPDYTDALICLADATTRLGKLDEAETALRQLVRLHPENSELRINFGSLLFHRGRADEALEQYATAIRLDPKEPIGYYDLGTLLVAQGKFPEAAARFVEALKLKPDYLEARVALSRALANQGDFQAAAKALQQAIELTPSNAVLYLELGKVLNLANETNTAAICLSNAFRLDPSLASKTKGALSGSP